MMKTLNNKKLRALRLGAIDAPSPATIHVVKGEGVQIVGETMDNAVRNVGHVGLGEMYVIRTGRNVGAQQKFAGR